MDLRHHTVRNLAVLTAAAAGTVIYTIISETRRQFLRHPTLTIPPWLSKPHFVPTVITPPPHPNMDYDRFDVELPRQESGPEAGGKGV